MVKTFSFKNSYASANVISTLNSLKFAVTKKVSTIHFQ